MQKTRFKILKNATLLFNQHGVSNVRLHDIAAMSDISPGNLSYHYRTKKDLMEGVLDLMQKKFKEMSGNNNSYLENDDYQFVAKSYLKFQIEHRFFYRDILEIFKLLEVARDIYEKQMWQVVNFTKNGMYLGVGKGIIRPEAHKGEFTNFAKNTWAILNSWLLERELFGENKVSMLQVINAIWEYHFPYLTDEGIRTFQKFERRYSEIIHNELAIS